MASVRPGSTTRAILAVCVVAVGLALGASARAEPANDSLFNQFVLLTDEQTTPEGRDVWFGSNDRFTGRVHTNSRFRFAYGPVFVDSVSSVDSSVTYFNRGKPITRRDDPLSSIDRPWLVAGFARGQGRVDLPADASLQLQNAALGPPLTPLSTKQATDTDIRTALRLTGSGAPPKGVYLPTTTASNARGYPSLGATTTGGLYVQGDLDSLVASVDSAGRQVYRLVQDTTVVRITVDPQVNMTFFKRGRTATIMIGGLPRGMLFVHGAIRGLSGPARVGRDIRPALADGTWLQIVATSDIVLIGDLTYSNFEHGNSVLGLHSLGGRVRIGRKAPNDLHLDALVLAVGPEGSFEVDRFGSGRPRGTFHLRGGVVSRYCGAFSKLRRDGRLKNGYARDFRHDARSLAPPYYPGNPYLQPPASQ